MRYDVYITKQRLQRKAADNRQTRPTERNADRRNRHTAYAINAEVISDLEGKAATTARSSLETLTIQSSTPAAALRLSGGV